MKQDEQCAIAAVGRRRDGGTKYWCSRHFADATAKYGRPAPRCRYADVPPVAAHEELTLDVDKYPGGVALWGAVMPVYDTTTLPLEHGIHVHARTKAGDMKAIDATFRRVTVVSTKRKPKEAWGVSDLDAIYYMVSSVFGHEMRHVLCTHCGYAHLDRDWFSVHPHQRHLCARCGKTFRDATASVGNPILAAQSALGLSRREPKLSSKKLDIKQRDFRFGLQIWGSNPAILWTGSQREEAGIHVHGFEHSSNSPSIDDTFESVRIDGISLNAKMVRTLMAQSGLPHLAGRITALACMACNRVHFDGGQHAYEPQVCRSCAHCGEAIVSSARLRKVISNPAFRHFEHLAALAPRAPARRSMGLIPETL